MPKDYHGQELPDIAVLEKLDAPSLRAVANKHGIDLGGDAAFRGRNILLRRFKQQMHWMTASPTTPMPAAEHTVEDNATESNPEDDNHED